MIRNSDLRSFVAGFLVLLLALPQLACFRREVPAAYALVCPPEEKSLRVIVPYTVKGMGSAHYPGPPYSYDSFDVLVFHREGNGSEPSLAQLLRYKGDWPIEVVRGQAQLQDGTLELSLEFLSRGSGGRSDAWEPYPMNGSYPLRSDDCKALPPAREGLLPAIGP